MAGVTDIVDWTYNETGLSYDWTNPTSSTLSTMYDMSPIKHIGNIKAPVYLMIGKYNIWRRSVGMYMLYDTRSRKWTKFFLVKHLGPKPPGNPSELIFALLGGLWGPFFKKT